MDTEAVVVACQQNQRHQNFNVLLLLSRLYRGHGVEGLFGRWGANSLFGGKVLSCCQPKVTIVGRVEHRNLKMLY